MRAIAFAAEAAVFGTAFAVKIRDYVRGARSPAMGWPCATLGFATLSSISGIPALLTFVELHSGVPALWFLCPTVFTCATARATLYYWAQPRDIARHKTLAMLPVYGISIATIILLTVIGRDQILGSEISAHQESPEAFWATKPYDGEAYAIYIFAVGLTWFEASRLLARNVRIVDRKWLRRALLLIFIGSSILCVYSASMIAYVVGLRFGTKLQSLPDSAQVLATIGDILSGLGVIMPTMGPRWDRMVAYRRLEPLWLALRAVAPDVILDSPRSIRIDSWNPHKIDFRLYRRVIEIRDGTLALRPYFDRGAVETARRLGNSSKMSSADVEAAVHACQLAIAIRDRREGRLPAEQANWAPTPTGGTDLEAELAALLPLAKAFATSRIVEEAVG